MNAEQHIAEAEKLLKWASHTISEFNLTPHMPGGGSVHTPAEQYAHQTLLTRADLHVKLAQANIAIAAIRIQAVTA